MSYDIYLRATAKKCETCGHIDNAEPDLPEPTYNLTPIFDRALTGEDLPNLDISEGAVVLLGKKTDRPRGLRLLSGKHAKDTIGWLRKAVEHLNDPAQKAAFKALEPSNGWGDLEGAKKVMAKLLSAAEEYPENVWEVH